MPGDLRGGLGHAHGSAQQVQAAHLERDELAGPQAGVGGEADQHPVRRGDGVGQGLDLGRGQEVHLPALDLGELDALGHIAGQPAPIHRAPQDLRENLVGLTGTLGRQAIGGQLGHPLPHRQGVDGRQRHVPELRQHLVLEQRRVVLARARAQRGRRPLPALGPLGERHPTGGRVDVGAAQLGVLDADQEPLGVDLAGEALGPLSTRGIAVVCPPPRPTLALLRDRRC
jgi:hypothetical protein